VADNLEKRRWRWGRAKKREGPAGIGRVYKKAETP